MYVMRDLFLPATALCLAFSVSAFAQPAPAPDPAHKPPALWGTVISRDQFKPLTPAQRWGLYWRQSYGTPGPYAAAFGSAVASHLDNDPEQWGEDADGYFKRVGNRFVRSRIRSTIEAAGSAALQHEVRYVRCQCTGALRRTGYALGMNFVTLNKKGEYVPHVSRIGGAFASEYIGNTWMPPGYRDNAEAMRGIGLQLAFGSLFNTFREFSPEIKRLFKRN